MASQTWQQVLLADPNNTEALGGLARAAKLEGKSELSAMYLARLRAINPNDPGIARAESAQVQQDHNTQLQQAGKLAQAGQYAQAMQVYRQVYGEIPPPGEGALAYYETEAATEDGRPHAIAGLRKLDQQFPSDPRYQIALGRILTYNPKTRSEGRKYLERHPDDPQATEALRQSLLWDAQNPASSGEIRAYLQKHPDEQLATVLRNQPKGGGGRGGPPVKLTPEQLAAENEARSRTAEERAAYAALNAKHMEDAEARFKAILAKNPENASALAGMGYIRMQQANFGGAMSFLVQAKQDGSKDPGLDPAIATSRFWSTMADGASALNENDLPTAEKEYRAALAMRPNSPEALEGLGGTLLKAQQPEAAAPVFVQFVKVKPAAPNAWRGLFSAQYNAGDTGRALETERHIPAPVRAQLMKDPLYLRTLASAYASAGRDGDAQRVLRTALELPFPADARGVEAETQMQYASLLQAANHLDQAAGLYRQVLAKDQKNTGAWQGLVRVEHAMNQDQQALQTLESMPPATYEQAMRDPGFETTVASIYQVQGKFDVAQDLLEKAIAQQTTAGQKPSVPIQIQLAGIYMQRDNAAQAYPIYQQILSENPDRVDAWKGLLSSLHSTGKDQEALAQIQQIPVPVRAQLENDVDFLQVVGSVYNSLGQPQQAALFLNRVKQHYIVQNALPPADIDIQNAWLLYNGGNDAGLYKQLMTIGSRPDLSDEQRRTVQTIWTNWAVRRANQAAAAGNTRRSLAILNATARAFPDNPGVIKALAGGYSRDGQYKQSVMIWKSQNMQTATASDYKAAVGAALAANDLKDAETWLRFGLDQYPKDAEMLNLGAKFEQARGDTNRAAIYYRASLDAMPPADPGAELATELSRPVPNAGMRLPNGASAQDLSTLLQPSKADEQPTPPPPPVETQPYLPSYTNSFGQPPVMVTPSPTVPSYMASPTPRTPTNNATPRTRLKDYVPQASAEIPVPMDGTEIPVVQTVAYEGGADTLILTPAVYHQQQINRLTDQVAQAPIAQAPMQMAMAQQPEPLPQQKQGEAYKPYRASVPLTATPQGAATAAPATQDGYGPYVPYKAPTDPSAMQTAVPLQLGSTPTQKTVAQPEVTDVLPKAKYVPNAKAKNLGSSHPDINAANAAAIRRRQSNPDALTGRSAPPPDDYSTTPTENTQYAPAGQTGQPATGGQNTTQTYSGQSSSSQTNQAPPSQTGDSNGQQYPQPNTSYRAPATGTTTTGTRSRVRTRRAAQAATGQPDNQPQQPSGPVLSYPGVGTPLGYQPYPILGSTYPLGAAPTDSDLVAKHIPALRGYSQDELLTPQLALTPRQQTERDLATLEASYSGWFGGTASGRYRSGTPGIDRLSDTEATIEASAMVNNSVRLTVVPRAVFLNSGVLNVANYSGLSSISVPIIGTLSANAANAPAEQFASGVGGELQMTTRNFAASVGYTPYNFLIQTVTGHGLWKPSDHFTFSFDRDMVKDSQLSYAGLRDPGQASAVNGGPIWGGVVATGGGLRFDNGDEKAGFYITADGADLSGYHVLGNYKFEGSMGAYFLAHTFPGYGKLNIGASLFGMHYAHNERGESYGLGGYFSPDAYFLASIPITYTGYYKTNFHYSIAGAVGVQTFQEDSQIFFPLDPAIETSYRTSANAANPIDNSSACTIAQIATHVCGESPVNSNTGFNYNINAEAAYAVTNHWFVGGFLSGNNTVSGGFFVRYTFRPQYPTEAYPTGLFPVEGFRPLRVP
ncbi:Tetratricopeptide repeat-containing protein [Granulicella rosea]|uniref:Tetratricopeptide repeat-containing protein n=1 Tax=Granulicella rosea TaxID=474952 RepID=A0A239EWL2_9BACT|nr:cellulose biosynthesis protein BcsC [Granulicella rosea]SNS49009.1 Tetratricopeptide repeat-containing protein [Granulicella rosea]